MVPVLPVAKVRVTGMPQVRRARTQRRSRWPRSGAAGSKSSPATLPLCAIWSPTAPTRPAIRSSRPNSRCSRTRWARRALSVLTCPRSAVSASATARRSRERSRSYARTSSWSWRGAGSDRVSTGLPPPRAQPTTTAGGSASPRTSSTRPSRCANSSGRPPSMSGSDARSARTARRAIVAGGSRRPYASATARMAAMTSLLDEPMPSPSGTSPLRVNSPPRHGAWPRRAAHSSIASAAARSAFARSAGNTASCPGEVPGLGVNSARVPGPCIGSVTRPAQGRSFSSRKTPCRISPWWHAANPTPMRLAPPPPPVPPYAVTSRPPRGSGTASSARRRTARTGRARRTGR